jgi:hypothetical protein
MYFLDTRLRLKRWNARYLNYFTDHKKCSKLGFGHSLKNSNTVHSCNVGVEHTVCSFCTFIKLIYIFKHQSYQCSHILVILYVVQLFTNCFCYFVVWFIFHRVYFRFFIVYLWLIKLWFIGVAVSLGFSSFFLFGT